MSLEETLYPIFLFFNACEYGFKFVEVTIASSIK